LAPITPDGTGPAGTNGGYDYGQEFFGGLTPDGGLVADNGTNRYNYAPINHFLRPITQWSAGAFVDYQINEHFTPYMEFMYNSSGTRAQIAESGTFFAEAYILGLDDFPQAFQDALTELYPDNTGEFGVYVGKRNVEGGPVLTTSRTTVSAWSPA
jgi:iron complex outermembrane receptor protein